jgi:xanthine dehydrogenase molybdopterin-binding subunit B
MLECNQGKNVVVEVRKIMQQQIHKGEEPVHEQFQHDSNHVGGLTNPIDDLLLLAERLRHYEQKYNFSSS